jgi:hypothetical protein
MRALAADEPYDVARLELRFLLAPVGCELLLRPLTRR